MPLVYTLYPRILLLYHVSFFLFYILYPVPYYFPQISDLQEELSNERMNNSSAKQELQTSQARIDEFRKKIAGLEETNLGLGQKADSLAASLEEEGSLFRAQLRAKEEEVEALQGGLVGVRQDYQVRLSSLSSFRV